MDDKAKLLEVFKANAYGRDQAKNKDFFCVRLDLHERTFRLMAEELVKDGEPICSHPDFGYWYAASVEDGDAALADLRSRENKLRERRSKLEKNIHRAYGQQLALM